LQNKFTLTFASRVAQQTSPKDKNDVFTPLIFTAETEERIHIITAKSTSI